MRPDAFFSAEQQQQLMTLMAEWRNARAAGQLLATDKQQALASLVEAELLVSAAQSTEIITKAHRMHQLQTMINQIRGGLIVSCQALSHEPLYGAAIMARMAMAAQEGGAVAIRANTPVDIAAIRAAVDLPIIGLYKEELPGYPVYITPTLAHAKAVAAAGADIIAIDATARPRPQPGTLADFIAAIHVETGRLVLADIATVDEGIAAEAAGADLVSTTMSGYTADSPQQAGPDLTLVQQLAARLTVPLLAEGRFKSPAEVKQALALGATAVVVGGAITRPQQITRWFVDALPKVV